MKKLAFILAMLFVFTACSSKAENLPGENCTLPEDIVITEPQPEKEEPAKDSSAFLDTEGYSFTEDYFKSEVRTFISCHKGEFDFTKGGSFSPEEIAQYAITRVYQIMRDSESQMTDDSGELVVPEEKVNDFAQKVLFTNEISAKVPSENGFYYVPYHGRYLNAEFSKIDTEGVYAVAVVDFYDLDDAEKKTMLWQMEYAFIPLEYNNMEIFFSPIYARLLYGEER